VVVDVKNLVNLIVVPFVVPVLVLVVDVVLVDVVDEVVWV
jgi:hypothetical protein